MDSTESIMGSKESIMDSTESMIDYLGILGAYYFTLGKLQKFP